MSQIFRCSSGLRIIYGHIFPYFPANIKATQSREDITWTALSPAVTCYIVLRGQSYMRDDRTRRFCFALDGHVMRKRFVVESRSHEWCGFTSWFQLIAITEYKLFIIERLSRYELIDIHEEIRGIFFYTYLSNIQ